MTQQEMKTVNKKLLEKFSTDKKDKVKADVLKSEDISKRKDITKQYTQVT